MGTLTKKSLIPSPRKVKDPLKEKFKDNTTVNNTFNNTVGETSSPELPKKKVVRFKEPTLEEVSDYCRKERNNTIDAQNFIDFYTSKGWKVGNTKMKDWQASVRTWETNDKKRNAQNANKQNAKSEYASLNSDYNKSTGLV